MRGPFAISPADPDPPLSEREISERPSAETFANARGDLKSVLLLQLRAAETPWVGGRISELLRVAAHAYQLDPGLIPTFLR